MGDAVRLKVPAEHANAVRANLLENVCLLADRVVSLADEIQAMAIWLAADVDEGELRLYSDGSPGGQLALRDWAKEARRDAERTLENVSGYEDRDHWERRSKSLLAVSAQVLERVGGR